MHDQSDPERNPASTDDSLSQSGSDAVLVKIDGGSRDLDGFVVRRVLPSIKRRMIGPFVFFDHMGPATLPPGRGLEVRPHPHINLATVTYLFEGQILHRDSLGSEQAIDPGAINWMTAGRGIVHSERTAPELREKGFTLHGIQLWLALPTEFEEVAPEFHHHPAASIPQLRAGGATLRVLAGEAYGMTSPVKTYSPLFYVDALMPAGSTTPLPDGYQDRAFYVARGRVRFDGITASEGEMVVVRPERADELIAEEDARVMMLGGAPLDGPRHIWWNFVSSRKERIEQAKEDWTARRFPLVPGDETEFIPLP